jgi:hypothetical protein
VAEETVAFLKQQAVRCRRFAREVNDDIAQQRLTELAEDYEARVRAAEDANRPAATSE